MLKFLIRIGTSALHNHKLSLPYDYYKTGSMHTNYHIGCSGWVYSHWKGLFYPSDLPQSRWLHYYAQHYKTVEVNNTFYGSPSGSTLEKWYWEVPDHFRFSLKGSRYITHMKKLKDVAEPLKRFYKMAGLLREKVGCILWQLPPQLIHQPQRLQDFCRLLSAHYQNVVEFRDVYWYQESTYRILSENQAGFCVISAPDLPADIKTTNEMTYIRFHGRTSWYSYRYSKGELQEWAQKIKQAAPSEVYAYFNNDHHGNALYNARLLQELLASGSR